MKKVDIEKLHRVLKPIWKQHFRHTMSYDAYFEQILRYNIFPLAMMKTKRDRNLFMDYKNKTIRLTLQAIAKTTKSLGIGTEFNFDNESGD
jgi:hypothetical protein